MAGGLAQGLWLEALFIGILILLNGFFAGAEIALVSARRSRVRQLAAAGDPRAERVARLQEDPDRFLATVQIGITFVATLASAVGGAAAVRILSPLLRRLPIPLLATAAEPLALAVVVLLLTYVMLIVGELTPKSLALRHAVALALWVSGPIERLARATAVLVRCLTASNRLVLRLLGQRGGAERVFVSEDEVKHMLREGRALGIFDRMEEELIHSVFEFAEASVKDVMVPRPRIQAIDIETSVDQVLAYIIETGKSRYPVYRNSLDEVIGILYDKDLFRLLAEKKAIRLQEILRPATFAPETAQVSHLLKEMQQRRMPMALVVDEYGGVEGLVTIEDLIEEIVGEIQDDTDQERRPVQRLRDGSYLVDASLSISDLAEQHQLRFPESTEYDTLAGFILAQLQRIPRDGEVVTHGDWRLTIVSMEGRRIARVKIERRRRGDAPPPLPRSQDGA